MKSCLVITKIWRYRKKNWKKILSSRRVDDGFLKWIYRSQHRPLRGGRGAMCSVLFLDYEVNGKNYLVSENKMFKCFISMSNYQTNIYTKISLLRIHVISLWEDLTGFKTSRKWILVNEHILRWYNSNQFNLIPYFNVFEFNLN